MKRTHFLFVGGFLGAGKTTLLKAAARHLARQGKRVGMITNDQAENLVDTALLRRGRPRLLAELDYDRYAIRFLRPGRPVPTHRVSPELTSAS